MSNKRSRPTTERGIVGYAAAGAAQGHQGIPVDRAIAFTARLRSINKQYAEWVQQQSEECLDELWLDGADSYQRFIRSLLHEFDDIMGDAARESSPQDVAPSNLFGTPAAGIGPPGSKAAAHTGVSTGRKSVTWAETPVDLGGPAAARPLSGTPNPNTANAGHTPAPAGFRAAAGTPGSSTDGTPAAATPLFRLTPGADAAAAALGGGGSGFGNGVAAAMQRAAAAATTPPPAASSSPAVGGFSLGTGSGGGATPGVAAAGGGDAGATPAAPASGFALSTAGEGFGTPAPVGSTPGGFTFGTPGGLSAAGGTIFGATPAAAAGGGAGSTDAAAAAAAAAPDSSKPAAFSFGLPASSSAAGAAAAASSPAFAFGAPHASNGTTSAASQGAVSSGVTPPAGPSSSGAAPASAGFSFGALPSTAGAAASTSSPAFAFAATGAASSGMFQFPAPSAAAAAANGNDGGADGGDDDAAPVEEATQVQVDGSAWKVLFNEKAKLFARVNNDWQHRGVGMCSVRQPTGGPSAHKSYLMFTTLNGKQLASHELKAGAAVTRFDNSKKACRMSLTTIEYELPPAGSQQGEAPPPKKTYKLEVCLLQFGKGESVDTLEQLVEQHRAAA